MNKLVEDRARQDAAQKKQPANLHNAPAPVRQAYETAFANEQKKK